MLRASLFASIFVLALPGAARAQGALLRGPMLNDVTTDAVTVVWESPTPTTGVVRYGLTTPNAMSIPSAAPRTHHAVRITGLSALAPAGSQFQYEVEVGGVVRGGSFKTAVPSGAPFSFIVYGDNRSSPAQHQAVVDALLAEPADSRFAINTGDLVSDGANESHWDTFFEIEAPFLASHPLYIAIGNHEVDRSGFAIAERLFAPPTTVPPASNREGFHHFVYGNVDFIILNHEVDSLYTLSFLQGDQEPWLEDVLAMRPPGVDHRFVFIHKGPYSSKPGRTGNFWLRQWLEPLRDGGVSVLFSGHDHYAERGWTENGLYYVIHGGGGAPLYDTYGPRVTSDHTIMYGETRLGYAVVSVDGPRVTVTLKGLAGEVVDTFTYGDVQSPECAVANDCGAPPLNGCVGGEWSCERSACTFACNGGSGGLIACVTDAACVDQIGANCPGTPTCEHPSINPLEWYCICNVPPECTSNPDCAGRPPPIPDCPGTWACVTETCEFTPDTVCEDPPDAGTPSEDASVADGSAGDAAERSDSGATDSGVEPRDSGVEDASASPVDSGSAPPALPPSPASCGCRSTASSAETASWLGLGLALAAGARRRRRT